MEALTVQLRRTQLPVFISMLANAPTPRYVEEQTGVSRDGMLLVREVVGWQCRQPHPSGRARPSRTPKSCSGGWIGCKIV